ncbi:MAG: hypothetical protein VB078_10995 [Clostridiaceae bacterium]|nr:hypothetical protein [Clostridiaceae bacterium]
MQEKFKNSRFALLYIWMAKAKYTMGIFYVFIVFFYLVFGAISVAQTVTLDLPTSMEMLFACFFIGLTQQIIMAPEHLTAARSLLWIGSGALITAVFSVGFKWFEGFPSWCLPLFMVCMVIAMAAVLLNIYFQLHNETRMLNKQLEHFQNNSKLTSHPKTKEG